MTDNVRSRRNVILSGFAAGIALSSRFKISRAQGAQPVFSFPVGLPGRPLGDGLLIRHGFTCENTWYNTGWLHTVVDRRFVIVDQLDPTKHATIDKDLAKPYPEPQSRQSDF